MNIVKLNYEMNEFNDENVKKILSQLNLNSNNYFIAMTKPSLLNLAVIGNIAEFANRYCIICFSESEVNLIMLSRISNKKTTELIKINHNEINDIKLSNILISYMMNIKCEESNIKLQVFKKVAKFSNIKNSINVFKKMYNLK